MRYMLLVYHSEDAWRARPAAERQSIYDGCLRHNRTLAEDGVLIEGAPLEPVASAQTVRVRNGETVITDGPFAETKEQLGGYFLLNCPDREDACRRAEVIIEKQQNRRGGMEVRAFDESE